MAERMDWHYIYKSSERLAKEKLHHTPSCAVPLYCSKCTSSQYMRVGQISVQCLSWVLYIHL